MMRVARIYGWRSDGRKKKQWDGWRENTRGDKWQSGR